MPTACCHNHSPKLTVPALQASTDDDEYGDGYGSDLMGDDTDRARLAAMTELDREMELLERSDRRAELQEKRKLARQQQEQQAAADKVSHDQHSILTCSKTSGWGHGSRAFGKRELGCRGEVAKRKCMLRGAEE